MSSLDRRITDLRAKGLKWRQVAKELGVSQATASRWGRDGSPSVNKLRYYGNKQARYYEVIGDIRYWRKNRVSWIEIGERVGLSAHIVKRWHNNGPPRKPGIRKPRAENCQQCSILMAESQDETYPQEPEGEYCWNCRELYSELR